MKYAKGIVASSLAIGAISCTPDNPPPEGGDNPPSVDKGKPNVVVILADDMGYGDISRLNPESKIRTSNIDNLCRGGIAFTDAHSSSALSTPSRYSLLTGRYPWRTTLKSGVVNGFADGLVAAERSTIADMFDRSGYNTACIGKWHLGWDWSGEGEAVDYTQPITGGPTDCGFDYFYGISASLDMPPYVYIENDRVVKAPNRIMPARTGLELMRQGVAADDFVPEEVLPTILDHSLSYIESQKSEQDPFFLYIPITAPHTPILPSDEFKGRSAIGVYGDFVLQIDDMVRQVVAKLKSTGQWDNTIVVFTSDNGCAGYIQIPAMEAKGHHPSYIYRGYKTDAFEGGHRIPLIVSWGDKFFGKIDNSLVSLTDLFATFADMVHYTPAPNEAEDSFSFWSTLSGAGAGARSSLVAVSGNGFFTYREGSHKIIFAAGSGGDSSPTNAEAAQQGLPALQLYDLGQDPGEKTNLVEMPAVATQVAGMKSAMKKIVEEGRSTPGSPQSNDTGNKWSQTNPFM